MAANPDRHSKTPGYHRGTGTTSTGVHYDLRPEDSPTDTASVRAQALRIARERMASASAAKKSTPGKKLRPAALGMAVLLLFAGAATFFGDQLWDSVTLPAPTVVTSVAHTQAPTPTARPAQTTVPAARPQDNAAVYLPKSGTRYHASAQCSGMKDAAEATLADAIDQGYLPCKRCNPPPPAEEHT